ncbi:flavodoxin family protein [Amphibacillus jilinensis]|uniref:flavodoxin family protein n=1 Tax=Amphibacillus jilinensis TaxID=1216008 RepID=UPI0002E0E890|nr:flavodoxin family protein [Amphibacillus jilinensis]
MSTLVLLGSSRRNGNTEHLVNVALQGIEHEKIYLLENNIFPIVDQRHVTEGFSPVHDDYERLFSDFLKHDTLFFVTPLYWFGMSGQMKIFFDRWSQYLRDDRFDFTKEMMKKRAYVIVVGENPDPKITSLPLIQQFNYIFDYVGIEFVDYIIGKGNYPNDILEDSIALKKSKSWNRGLKANVDKET